MTIREIRELTGLSRPEFSKKYYDIPIRSLENWEYDTSKCPEYVIRLLEYKVKMDLMKEAPGN